MIPETDFYAVPRVGKVRKFFAHTLSAMVPNRQMRNRVRNIVKFGILRAAYVFLTARHKRFEHFLSVAAIARNEGRYFKEWIDYHRLVGVEKFYIYDNQSTDDTYQILKPYIDAGIVEYHYVKGEGIQNEVNFFACVHARSHTKWLAVIDLDEFIMPIADQTIPDFLRRLSPPPCTAQIFVRWCLFGSSGHVTRPDGLVIENYKYRKADNSNEANKIIINPRMVAHCGSAHSFDVIGKSIDECGNIVSPSPVIPNLTQNNIRINHYRCKSWQDSQEKHNKGDVLYGRNYVRYTKADFDKFDTNEVYDNSMDKYAAALHKIKKI